MDPIRCKERVWSEGMARSHQCNRKAVKDGYCKQHHPDSVKARQEASEARYREQVAKNPYVQLTNLKDKYDKLEAQNKEMLEALKQMAYCASHQCGFGCNVEKCPKPLKIQALIARIEGGE